MRLLQSSSSFANSHNVLLRHEWCQIMLSWLWRCCEELLYCAKLGRIMAFLLQSLKDFADNRYSLLGVGAALVASALLALGYCYRRNWNTTWVASQILRTTQLITGILLTLDMFSLLKDKCTSEGYDIDDLIDSSQHNLSTNFTSIPNSAGLLAGDEECYDLFSEFIDPVTGEVHQIDEMKSLRSD